MARPSKTQAIDLSSAVQLTSSVIERLTCPPEKGPKGQVFLRDSLAPGLKVRVSASGSKSFVFERKVGQQTVRRTIGDVRHLTIDQARDKAREAYVALDKGIDVLSVEKPAEIVVAPATPGDISVGAAWTDYLETQQKRWGERHYEDHVRMAQPGGHISKRGTRGTGITKPGPLHSMLVLPLAAITSEWVEAWSIEQSDRGKTQARLGARILKAFLNWCTENPCYADQVPRGGSVVKSRRTRDTLGKAKAKNGAVMREQLPAWFKHVREIPNKTISAYLQTMLLVGPRPGELLELKWADIDWKWRSLHIRDKVEGDRYVPLTEYVSSLLDALPRTNEWVFASGKVDGPITSPNHAHDKACEKAAINNVDLHSLRRSFRSLTEWLDIPSGVVAQIQGHKPSATQEKHYTVRPLDLLRIHHQRIETWMLDQAVVESK